MVGVSLGIFTNSYGVFYTSLAQKLGVGRGAVSQHAAIAGLVTAFSQPIFVRLLEKIRLQWIVLTGIVLMVSTTLLTAAAGSVWQLNLIGVIRGIGIGCCYVPVVTTILSKWFHSHYGVISGATLSFSGVIGAVLSQLLARSLIRFGMRATYAMVAVGIAVALLPAMFFCRTHPEEFGLIPWGAENAQVSESSETVQSSQSKPGGWKLILLCVIAFLVTTMTAFTQHLTSYTQVLGLKSTVGATMISAVMVGNILFKLLSGVLADWLGAFRSAEIFMLLTTASMGILFLCPTGLGTLLAASVLLGSSYAVGTVGLSNVTRSVYGNEGYGRAFSLVNACGCVSASLSLSAIGYSYDWTGGYRLASIACVLFGIIGFIGLLIISHSKRKAK